MKSLITLLLGLFVLVSCDVPEKITITEAPTAMTSVSSIEPGNERCPHGGTLVSTGIDDNGNGVLDDEEVDSSEAICHGTPGEDGEDGQDGEQGNPGEQGDPGEQGPSSNDEPEPVYIPVGDLPQYLPSGDKCLEIANLDEFISINTGFQNANLEEPLSVEQSLSMHYCLTANIYGHTPKHVSYPPEVTPIGDCGEDGICLDDEETVVDETVDNRPFTGIFDGQGYDLRGFSIGGDALFGLIDGVVKNIDYSDNSFFSYVYLVYFLNEGGLVENVSRNGYFGIIHTSYGTVNRVAANQYSKIVREDQPKGSLRNIIFLHRAHTVDLEDSESKEDVYVDSKRWIGNDVQNSFYSIRTYIGRISEGSGSYKYTYFDGYFDSDGNQIELPDLLSNSLSGIQCEDLSNFDCTEWEFHSEGEPTLK